MKERTAAIVLRAGVVADLPGVAALMAASFDPRFGEAWTSAQCRDILSLPGIWLTIARRGDADIGFAMARVTLDESELLLLATHPDARRVGVGASLLRSVVVDAQARGARRLLLEVRDHNDAVDLYRREGFIKIGERRGYYRGSGGQLFDAHTYSRTLPELVGSSAFGA